MGGEASIARANMLVARITRRHTFASHATTSTCPMAYLLSR